MNQKYLYSMFFILFTLTLSSVKAQQFFVGGTMVTISIAVDSSHFTGGYTGGPWDLYWGPDQKLWYTNKTALCRYDPVLLTTDTLKNFPSGYLMSVTTHNDFQNQPFVYVVKDTGVYYGFGNLIQLYRYEYSFSGDSLFNELFILQWHHGGEHSGGRIIFGDDDKLYVTTAEYWMPYDTLFYNSGKVLRVNPDGSVPIDNPRADYTWTYGHRNPQGITQVSNGNIITSEYGQQWDELNLLIPDKFYGWMVWDGVTCFMNPDTCDFYDSTAVFPIDVGMNPPSGIDFYDHPAVPALNGIIEAVTGQHQGITAYTLNPAMDSVILKVHYLQSAFGRVRDVCTAPNGDIYFIAWDRIQADIRKLYNPLFSNGNENIPELIKIYPNPSDGNLTIETGSIENSKLTLVDLYGNTVLSKQDCNNCRIYLQNLANGIYFLKLTSADKGVYLKKLVVNK